MKHLNTDAVTASVYWRRHSVSIQVLNGAYTHIHSLCWRRGDVPSSRALHSLSIYSVWGGAGLQVLNVASRRTRIKIWWRFRKAQVLYACVMYWQMHIYGIILHIYFISDILFIVSIYFAYYLYVTYIWYIEYSPYIAYNSYFAYYVYCAYSAYMHKMHI